MKDKLDGRLYLMEYDRKFCSVTGNFFLWEHMSSSDKGFLSVTGNFFLWHKIFYQNFFLGKDYSSSGTKVCDFWSYIEIRTIVRDFHTKDWQRVQGFVARFLPPGPLKSHPGFLLEFKIFFLKFGIFWFLGVKAFQGLFGKFSHILIIWKWLNHSIWLCMVWSCMVP